MTKLVFWQGSYPPTDKNAFEHQKRALVGVFEVELQEVRERVEQSVSPTSAAVRESPRERERHTYLSRYDRNKVLKWFDAQDMSRDRIEMTAIQIYIRRIIVAIALRLVLRRKDDCFCRTCRAWIARETMGHESWEYYVNPLFAGTGHFLTCPKGHLLVSIQGTIS